MNPHDIGEDEMAVVVDDTIRSLGLILSRDHDTNATAELAAAIQFISHARRRLPDLVANARDQDTSWAEIATQLHLTRLGAMARYGHHARTRPQPLDPD
jgi:hypothetical protein